MYGFFGVPRAAALWAIADVTHSATGAMSTAIVSAYVSAIYRGVPSTSTAVQDLSQPYRVGPP